MAQHTSEPLSSVALEGFQVSAPLSLTLTSPVSPRAFHFQAQGNPVGPFGRHLTITPPKPVIESVTVTATQAMEPQLTTPPTQGFVISDSYSAAASSVIGSLPLG